MNPRSMSVPIGPKPPPRGEDLPYDDGMPMETSRHRAQTDLLVDSLDDEWAERTDVAVEGNMALYFSETQAKRQDFRAPDVFVVLDTVRRERKSWVVWEEEGRTPDLVVELVSESTEHTDRVVKKKIYATLVHVPLYVIYDPFSTQLDVFQLDAVKREYVQLKPDADGRYWLPRLDLFIGVIRGTYRHIEAPWLRWIRRDGTVVPHDNEIRRAAREHARAAEEQARAAEAHARAAEEHARAAEEQARAAEQRAARVEAELARLRTEGEKDP